MKYHRTGLITGCFDAPDSLHQGHKHILDIAWQLCQELIIGVNSDSYIRTVKGREPMSDELTRYSRLLEYGEVVIFDGNPQHLLDYYNVGLIIVGDDYTIDRVVGAKGRDVHFVKRIPGFSSSEIWSSLQQ